MLPLPRPRRSFYPEPTPLLRPRMLADLPLNFSIEDKDKFKEKEMMKKRRFAKTTWQDWQFKYVLELIKKLGGLKEKIINFKIKYTQTNAFEKCVQRQKGIKKIKKHKQETL